MKKTEREIAEENWAKQRAKLEAVIQRTTDRLRNQVPYPRYFDDEQLGRIEARLQQAFGESGSFTLAQPAHPNETTSQNTGKDQEFWDSLKHHDQYRTWDSFCEFICHEFTCIGERALFSVVKTPEEFNHSKARMSITVLHEAQKQLWQMYTEVRSTFNWAENELAKRSD